MTGHGSPDQPHERPMTVVLDVVASELADLTETADRVQLVLGAVLVEAARNDARLLVENQSLDLLVQRLQGLRQFVGALSEAVPPAWSADPVRAAQTVGLSDLAQRLACLPPGSESAEDAPDFELFG